MRQIAILGNDPLADRLGALLRAGQGAQTVRMAPAAPLKDCAAVIVTDAAALSPHQMQGLLKVGCPILGHCSGGVELAVLRQWHSVLQESGGSFSFAWPLRFSPAVLRLRDLLQGQALLAVRSLASGPASILNRESAIGPQSPDHPITRSPDPLESSAIPDLALPHALDLVRFLIGDITHVSAFGTTKGLSDPLAPNPAALAANLHAADRTLAQHVQVQSEKCCGELEVLTTTTCYRLDWLTGTLAIQDAAGEQTQTIPGDCWPALLRTFLDRLEPDSARPAHGFTEPGSKTQEIAGGSSDPMRPTGRLPGLVPCTHPNALPDFVDSFCSLAAAWAVVSALTSGQLTAVPLR